jgi:hypothetical protein
MAGAGLPVADPVGNLIVDMGGGTTDIALISPGGLVYAHPARIAGNAEIGVPRCPARSPIQLSADRQASCVPVASAARHAAGSVGRGE